MRTASLVLLALVGCDSPQYHDLVGHGCTSDFCYSQWTPICKETCVRKAKCTDPNATEPDSSCVASCIDDSLERPACFSCVVQMGGCDQMVACAQVCRPACNSGADCPAGTACSPEGNCVVPQCTVDADCSRIEYCGPNYACRRRTCASDADCPTKNCGSSYGFCLADKCCEGAFCSIVAPCTRAETCDDPDSNGGTCQPVQCAADFSCPNGTRCSSAHYCRL